MTEAEMLDALESAGIAVIRWLDRLILPGAVIYSSDYYYLYGVAEPVGPVPDLIESGVVNSADDLDRVIAHARATEAENAG